MTSKNTIDYCRISLDKKGEQAGVTSQHRENLELADEFGLEIAETFSDNDRSAKAIDDDGTSAPRPDYERLLAAIRADEIGAVIIWHADRFHRNVSEANAYIRLARKHGVKLYSVGRGGEYKLDKAAGRAALLKDTVNAQEESEHRGERVTMARKRQARQGDYGGGGRRPFGWGVDTGRTRRVCVNPKADPSERIYEDRVMLDMTMHNPTEAAEIKKMAADLLAGVKMAHVLRDLADRKISTVAGGSWSSRTVAQILTSPRTSGHTEYKGEIVTRNAFPEIIPDDQRLALITLLKDPARRTSPGNTPKWLGSLIVRCGVCDDGATMTVRKRNDGVSVYRCRKSGHCSRLADQLDQYIADVIITRLDRDDVTDLMPDASTVDVQALRDKLMILESKLTEAAEAYAQELISMSQMITATAMLNKQIASLRQDLSEAGGESPLAPFAVPGTARRTWKGLSLGRHREIVKDLAEITVFPCRPADVLDPATVKWEWRSDI